MPLVSDYLTKQEKPS